MLGAAVLVARQLPQDREPAAPPADAAELANRAAAAAAAGSVPDPRPHQWVYAKELMVESAVGKPYNHEWWIRVDGRKYAQATSDRRAAHPKKVISTRAQFPTSQWSRCPPGKREQLARIRPAVGLGKFLPQPDGGPHRPRRAARRRLPAGRGPRLHPHPWRLYGDNVQDRAFKLIGALLDTVQPPEVRAALYRALAKIPEVTVAHGATDAAGRRGVAFTRAASIEAPGSSDWLRLEIILDNDTYRYLGARYIVTRDHFTPNIGPRSKGIWHRPGQVLLSTAQLALAVVDVPCRRPGETTTCASYGETTWVGG